MGLASEAARRYGAVMGDDSRKTVSRAASAFPPLPLSWQGSGECSSSAGEQCIAVHPSDLCMALPARAGYGTINVSRLIFRITS